MEKVEIANSIFVISASLVAIGLLHFMIIVDELRERLEDEDDIDKVDRVSDKLESFIGEKLIKILGAIVLVVALVNANTLFPQLIAIVAGVLVAGLPTYFVLFGIPKIVGRVVSYCMNKGGEEDV